MAGKETDGGETHGGFHKKGGEEINYPSFLIKERR
jgi:hypothetical protein